MSKLTTDPNDPRLGHGADDKPVPQQEAYLVLSEEEQPIAPIAKCTDPYQSSDGAQMPKWLEARRMI